MEHPARYTPQLGGSQATVASPSGTQLKNRSAEAEARRTESTGKANGGAKAAVAGQAAATAGPQNVWHNTFSVPLVDRNHQSNTKVVDIHRHVQQPQLPTTAERLKSGQLNHVVNSSLGRQMDLKRQFELHERGDVARQLRLADRLRERGGWDHRLSGTVSGRYTQHAFGHYYAGPGLYRQRCWYPNWSPWVNWSWNYYGVGIYDPRPLVCQPFAYGSCGPWIGGYYPGWATLPYGACGTWVGVPAISIPQGIDLQLLAVRFVDSGHPERRLGPRYRVWFRNNSDVAIDQAFDVLLVASNDQNARPGLPEAGVRVTGIGAGEIQAVDVRLTYEANLMGQDARGRAVPFRFLTVIVDAQRELPDMNQTNNGAVLDRLEISPIDPTIFSAALEASDEGSRIDIAGEGLGPEPGQVVIRFGDSEIASEILGWYDLGILVRLTGATPIDMSNTEILVIRGDGAASNPLHLATIPTGEVVPQPVP